MRFKVRTVKITPHARKRFRERFRLQFHPDIFREGRDLSMIRKLFSEAKSVDFALMQSRGHYNALCIKHGKVVRVSKVRNFVFVHGEPDEHKEVVIYTMMQEGSARIAHKQF
jgi:hypothetical protein